jgi:hypothetical protein
LSRLSAFAALACAARGAWPTETQKTRRSQTRPLHSQCGGQTSTPGLWRNPPRTQKTRCGARLLHIQRGSPKSTFIVARIRKRPQAWGWGVANSSRAWGEPSGSRRALPPEGKHRHRATHERAAHERAEQHYCADDQQADLVIARIGHLSLLLISPPAPAAHTPALCGVLAESIASEGLKFARLARQRSQPTCDV